MNDETELRLYVQRHSVPDTLVQNVARRPSHTTRVLIDTCFSGDMLDDIQDESTAYIIKTNGGKPEKAGVSLASWTTSDFTSKGIQFVSDPKEKAARGASKPNPVAVDRNRNGYTIITATSPDEESLGPAAGRTFQSPVDGHPLKGSFFTQSLFAYLETGNGQLGSAFHEAQTFTSRKAIEVTKGAGHQVPRQFSTIPDEQSVIN
jgi:hypothetical protein